MSLTYTLYTGHDPFINRHYLLRVWSDGSHEISTRAHESDGWSPPVTLTEELVVVS